MFYRPAKQERSSAQLNPYENVRASVAERRCGFQRSSQHGSGRQVDQLSSPGLAVTGWRRFGVRESSRAPRNPTQPGTVRRHHSRGRAGSSGALRPRGSRRGLPPGVLRRRRRHHPSRRGTSARPALRPPGEHRSRTPDRHRTPGPHPHRAALSEHPVQWGWGPTGPPSWATVHSVSLRSKPQHNTKSKTACAAEQAP